MYERYYKKEFKLEELQEAAIRYFNGDDLAASVWINKYALNDIKKGKTIYYELSPKDTQKRLAYETYRIGQRFKNNLTLEEWEEYLDGFKTGMYQGSPTFGMGRKDPVSLSNCFVIGYPGMDSYGSICAVDEELVQLMKRRGGCGTDLSFVRPAGSPVNNSAQTSTGVVPFMERYSNSTREVAQDGRRGALMLSISVEHPDAEQFIDSKLEDGNIEGANISVRMTDNFLKQAISDSLNPDPDKQRLWKKIIYNATTKAEPGVLFWDTILRESPADCYADEGFATFSTNPCFTGDTLVAVVDDKKIIQPTTIKELADSGKGFKVFSARQTRSTKWVTQGLWVNEIKPATAFKTGSKKVLELKLSNGNVINCTEDHRLALANKEYVEAKDSLGKTLHDVIFHDKWITHTVNINKAKVIEINEIGEEDVYDLTVEDNHNFYIVPEINEKLKFKRGVLVHNCGEIPLSPYDSCRLTAHNLLGYVDKPFTKEASFNWNKFKLSIQIMMMMADNLVELELEKVQQIINKILSDKEPDHLKQREIDLWMKVYQAGKKGRRTGIGILALGDMLAALGLKYGTKEATDFSVKVYEFMTLNSYLTSYKLVQEHGREPFSMFDYEKEKNNPFLIRLTQSKNFPELSKEIERMWKNGKGRRNVALMTIAPTGSTSIMTQTTSGLEPLFSPFYTRQRKIEKTSGLKPDTVDVNGDWFIKYNVIHYPFINWYAAQKDITFDEAKEIMTHLPEAELTKLFEKSPWFGATAQDCDWVERINMQAGLQKWIDHSISVTVNLPKGTKPELVQTIYETAWKQGCKGCTIYVDGSKGNQILSTKTEKEDANAILTHDAPARPKELEAQIVRFNNNKEKWISVIGLFEGKPYEIFTGLADKLDIPGSITEGKLVKVDKRIIKESNSRYDFVYVSKQTNEIVTSKGVNEIFNREYYNYGKLISGLLRHGMPMHYVVSTIDSLEFDNDTINSWKNGVVRALRKYIKDKTETGDKCPDCGTKLRFESGCVICPNCGYSQCS